MAKTLLMKMMISLVVSASPWLCKESRIKNKMEVGLILEPLLVVLIGLLQRCSKRTLLVHLLISGLWESSPINYLLVAYHFRDNLRMLFLIRFQREALSSLKT